MINPLVTILTQRLYRQQLLWYIRKIQAILIRNHYANCDLVMSTTYSTNNSRTFSGNKERKMVDSVHCALMTERNNEACN